LVIAIDGPAGVGKSSIGEMLARAVDYKFLSTGQMYRALAWKALSLGADLENEEQVTAIALKSHWDFVSGEFKVIKIILDGVAMDSRLNSESVGRATSSIARLSSVRKFMCDKQREIGEAGEIVMEGRDIGSNVFPDAEIKIYLDASPQERAKRRVNQLLEEGKAADYEEIFSAIVKRDKQDAERKYNPLTKSKDYNVIDTTDLNKEQVLEKILKLYKDYCSVQ